MKKRASAIVLSLILAAVSTSVHGAAYAATKTLDYEPYAKVLSNHVNDRGLVDYKALKADPANLDAFLNNLAALDPAAYDDWSEDRKIALWINAYNAYTLKVIIDNYPIESGGFIASLRFPENSIRQIDGVWDELTWTVMGEEHTLGHMEHKILRAEFDEPRIHVALVCAALSCPDLRTEPFTGDKLDAQLDDQSRDFLDNEQKGLRIDREAGDVYLSSIFSWFGGDFERQYGTDGFPNFGATESAVLNFVTDYVDESQAQYLRSGDFDIDYMDYDWTLNE